MRRILVGIAVVVVVAVVSYGFVVRPSNVRDWLPEQSRLAWAEFHGDSVTIRDLRDFRWSADSVHPRWADRTYDLDRIETVWYIVSPFSTGWRGPAHTFLSFGFADSQYVAVSVEARKQAGEVYTMLLGMARRFELMYVIGDERDLIRLRTDLWGDDVYVYPVRATPEQVRALFVRILERATSLRDRPEFYNTLTNNCTTNIIAHVNRIAPGRVPWGWKTLLPGYTDEVAEALGLLEIGEPLESVRRRFLVNERAREAGEDALFSVRIRELESP